MLLSPNNRTIYTDAITPPAGYTLDQAIAATYSLDLTTLLSVPLQLVLQSTEDSKSLMRDPIALYEALQRATERVHVFTQHGRMQAPRQHHLLYSLLEPMITEVTAPRGGAFHPKIWVLRFVAQDGARVLFRLMLSSKNLTTDRCWDVALTLDGELGRGLTHTGSAVSSFLARLPTLSTSVYEPSQAFIAFVKELARVEWELPDGFETLEFHVLGMGRKKWRPGRNQQLVVISPFVGPEALKMLAETSESPVAVVSRPESLAEMNGKIPFQDAYVLHDAAETEDGEEEASNRQEIGLHAKAYMYEAGRRTHLTIGSANATDAALVAGMNVEILAELVGPTHKVGLISRFLNADVDSGLGQYLVPWSKNDADEIDITAKTNQKTLESARDQLLMAGLALECRKGEEHWVLALKCDQPVDLTSLKSVRAWPVTIGIERAVDASELSAAVPTSMRLQAMSSLTSLIAFRLEEGGESLSFSLNLSVVGMPDERARAILRSVVKNRQGFLRYLLMLLAGLGDGAGVGVIAHAYGKFGDAAAKNAFDDMPLLEELVRAFSRDPKRLESIGRLIDDIRDDGDADKILPDGFDKFWQVFQEAIALNG